MYQQSSYEYCEYNRQIWRQKLPTHGRSMIIFVGLEITVSGLTELDFHIVYTFFNTSMCVTKIKVCKIFKCLYIECVRVIFVVTKTQTDPKCKAVKSDSDLTMERILKKSLDTERGLGDEPLFCLISIKTFSGSIQ